MSPVCDRTCDRDRSRIVCVVGAPRSGTSVLAHALIALGMDLGSPDERNGYLASERRPFRELDQEIIRRVAVSSLLPSSLILRDGWERDERLSDLRDKALAVIANHLKGGGLWGWKMPATTLTIPFWESLMGPLEYIVCVRNPLAVARSLEGSPEVTRASTMRTGMITWLVYTSLALRYTQDRRRFIFVYERALENPKGVVTDIAQFLGVIESSKIDEAAGLFRQPRHQVALKEMMSHPSVPEEARTLYWLARALSVTSAFHDREEEQALNCAVNAVVDRLLADYCERRASWRFRVHDFLHRHGSRLIHRPLPPLLKRLKDLLTS